MRLYVGITDTEWLSLIRYDYFDGKLNNQVNFWTPGAVGFKALKPGEIFLFKLHHSVVSGQNGDIVGGGTFDYFETMDVNTAWEKFGRGNGRASLGDFQKVIDAIRARNNSIETDEIGCIVLKDIFFFETPIKEPADWRRSIVRGKTYDEDSEEYANLINAIRGND